VKPLDRDQLSDWIAGHVARTSLAA
jgi:hypothetical protein